MSSAVSSRAKSSLEQDIEHLQAQLDLMTSLKLEVCLLLLLQIRCKTCLIIIRVACSAKNVAPMHHDHDQQQRPSAP